MEDKKIIILIVISFLIGCIGGGDDKDKDGLPDKIEEKGWSIKVVYPTNNTAIFYNVSSDPTKKDTDGDGLTDFEESPYYSSFSSDPTKKDTDGDGLTDFEERELGSNPADWRHDADSDLFLDYYEILYYEDRGISHEKIIDYLKKQDVDEDGIEDGRDIDPLRDIKIGVNITGIFLKSNMADRDNMVEVRINVSTGTDWIEFPLPSDPLDYYPVIPGWNESLNYSCVLDANDTGEPGNGTFPLVIVILDMDSDFEWNWNDGIKEYDIVKIYKTFGAFAKNFNIFKDCGKYAIEGLDGKLYFEVTDKSK